MCMPLNQNIKLNEAKTDRTALASVARLEYSPVTEQFGVQFPVRAPT